MVFVELVLKHKHFLTSVWQRTTVTRTSLSAPRWGLIRTQTAVFTRANRTEPTQTNCPYWFQTHRCVWWESRGLQQSAEESRTGTGGHASVCDGVWRPSSPLSLCLLGDEVRSPRGHMERCWSRNHSSLTLRKKMSHTHLHQSITVHWVYLDGAAVVLSSDTPVLLCERAVSSPCAVTLFRPRVCCVRSLFLIGHMLSCSHVLCGHTVSSSCHVLFEQGYNFFSNKRFPVS